MKQRLLWATVAVVLAVVVGAFRFLAVSGFSNDHYMHLAAGQQIAMGEWPSRDYVELGLPLMEGLSAIPFIVLPDAPLFGEALLVAAMFGLAAVFTFYAARRLTGSAWIALLVVALEVVIFPRTYSYPKVLAYAVGFLAMWRYVERPSPSRMIQLALAVVVAFGLRYDHGLYLGIGGLLTVVLAALPAGRRQLVRRAAAFSALNLLLVAPYAVYVELHSGLAGHIMRGIDMQAVENSRGRTIPMFTSDGGFFAPNAEPWLFFLFHLLPLIAAIVVWTGWRRQPSVREPAMVAPLIVVALLADLGLIRDTVAARLPDAVVPAALLLGWLTAAAIRMRPTPAGILARVAAAAIVVLTMTSAAALADTKEQLEKAEMLGSPARLWSHLVTRTAELHERFPAAQMPSRVASMLVPFFQYSDRCLGRRDHILIPAFAPEIPVWARRPFAGGQVWFQPELLRTDFDHLRVMNRLVSQRVPVAILVSPSSEQVLGRFAELSLYLKDHFPERTILQTADGREITIAFASGLAAGRDHATGWPCFR